MEIKLNDICIPIQRRRIKRLNLYVKAPTGDVLITAPLRMPLSEIEAFARSKEAWILKNREKIRAREKDRIEKRTEFEKELSDPRIGRSDSSDKTALDEASLRARLQNNIDELLPALEARTGYHANTVRIRKMHTRWGSCSVKSGNIRIALELVYYDTACLEYILLHELIHTKIPNHGKNFKAELDKYMPDWRERRARLR